MGPLLLLRKNLQNHKLFHLIVSSIIRTSSFFLLSTGNFAIILFLAKTPKLELLFNAFLMPSTTERYVFKLDLKSCIPNSFRNTIYESPTGMHSHSIASHKLLGNPSDKQVDNKPWICHTIARVFDQK